MNVVLSQFSHKGCIKGITHNLLAKSSFCSGRALVLIRTNVFQHRHVSRRIQKRTHHHSRQAREHRGCQELQAAAYNVKYTFDHQETHTYEDMTKPIFYKIALTHLFLNKTKYKTGSLRSNSKLVLILI